MMSWFFLHCFVFAGLKRYFFFLNDQRVLKWRKQRLKKVNENDERVEFSTA